MLWLLGGYMFLYIHRPFETWPVLGALQLERVYMLLTILVWMFQPGKRWFGNRLLAAFAGLFAAALLYSLPLTFPFWAETAGDRRKRNLLLLYTGLSVLCILQTGSRGGFVGLSAFALLALLRSQHRARFAFLLVLVVPLILGLMRADLQTRFETIIDPSVGPANAQESAQGRLAGLLDRKSVV